MGLLPEDIVRRSFRASRFGRGYNEEDVDTLLNEIVAELERLHAVIADLRFVAEAGRGEAFDNDSRLNFEVAQLEQVRAERRELIADIQRLQNQYDELTASVTLDSLPKNQAVSEKGAR